MVHYIVNMDRNKTLNARISDDERAMLADLSAHLGVSQSGLIRQWIRREHEKVFGPPKPKRVKR